MFSNKMEQIFLSFSLSGVQFYTLRMVIYIIILCFHLSWPLWQDAIFFLQIHNLLGTKRIWKQSNSALNHTSIIRADLPKDTWKNERYCTGYINIMKLVMKSHNTERGHSSNVPMLLLWKINPFGSILTSFPHIFSFSPNIYAFSFSN